jgi:DNA helicase-2/ATP-dependent DNA helicase PcrA
MSHLENLNERQREAVLHTEGPLLVLAGAGAGKTRTIAYRILHLIKEGVAPRNILAVTFTNKAAREMLERVRHLIAEDKMLNLPVHIHETPFISTFHSLGAQMLREHARVLGIPKRFSIYDRADSARAVKEATSAVGLDPKQFEPRRILGTISREKGNSIPLEFYKEAAAGQFYPGVVALIWEEYEKILQREKALDFDDLLLKSAALLRSHPSVKKCYQDIWRYIHIDEYQDTNRVQYDFVSLLLPKERKNICVVGDLDQNIYSWRGADIANILDFETQYPEAKVIRLEENYRSTKTIVAASNEIIKKNKRRKEKNLFTHNAVGEKISLYAAFDEEDEARTAAGRAQKLIEKGIPPECIAVLYRANFQSRALEEAFLLEEVPYQVVGIRFFERKEVKDTLAFIKAALHEESVSDLKRIINVPPRGIGKITLLKLVEGKERELTLSAKKKVADFKAMLSDIRRISLTSSPSETIRYVLKRTGLEESLKAGTDEELERLENIRELATLARQYDDLAPEDGMEKLLEDAALATEQDELKEERSAVRLMTVHAAKGLEFAYVFIVGLEEGLFPHERLNTDSPESEADEEEERRLFYVALTRAEKKVFLSFAHIRTIFGSRQVNIPSEFITDIDENMLEIEEHMPENKRKEERKRTAIHIE